MNQLRRYRHSFWAAALACLLLAANPKNAAPATATTTFAVTADIGVNCIISATDLVFGDYTGVVSNSTSTVSVTCTNTAIYTVGLSAGSGVGATVTTRAMTGPSAAQLHYSMYSDSAMTKNWGNTVGTDTVSGVGTGSAQALTVYGQIPAGQFPNAGGYADMITATVTF